ncbi:ngg1p interacting factor 3 nif3 protein [Stemphylium lycopersici]|nr:ngg1p interacting factor 3 nif3 protein [Stemphylium lycopersici]RAR07516.1 ngg1p interacting factor 3 nif3 protein [Stemphylium lycopersici]
MSKPKKATHAAVTRFIETYLPLKENDVQRLYHVPRNPRYDPETAVVEQIVLSVTPTPGVYSLVGQPPDESSTGSPALFPQIYPRPPRTLCFLHRPFNLDRRSVRKGTLVLSSHTSFDEILTVGWNTALAERLGMNTTDCLCVQGYKGDPERKIGSIGQTFITLEALMSCIQGEFGVSELAYAGLSDEVRIVAIMNAFNEGEVHRVVEMAKEQGWLGPGDDCRHVLYLTGQPRVSGLDAAKAMGMSVACVGHRQAEDWGIRYLGEELRRAFPNAQVEEVYEEEIPIVKEKKQPVVQGVLCAVAKTTKRIVTAGRSKPVAMQGSNETDPKSLVSNEATSILRGRPGRLSQPLTFTVRACPSKYDVSLYYTRHVLQLISEGRAADVEDDGNPTELLLPWLFCGSVVSKLRIEDLSSTKLPPGSPIKDGAAFRAFYERTMRQLHYDSTVVVRLLLDTSVKDDPFAVASFWGEIGIHLRPFARMIKFRFVFVVTPQNYGHCKQLASEPAAFPTWFTEDMWVVEVSNGRCDPAVD